MSKNTKQPTRKPGLHGPARLQVPAMYLHPDSVKLIDNVAAELASNRGIAVDEICRRLTKLVLQAAEETRRQAEEVAA